MCVVVDIVQVTLLASLNWDRIVLFLLFYPETADSFTLSGVFYLNENNLFFLIETNTG